MYTVGQKVIHETLGEGVVVKIETRKRRIGSSEVDAATLIHVDFHKKIGSHREGYFEVDDTIGRFYESEPKLKSLE